VFSNNRIKLAALRRLFAPERQRHSTRFTQTSYLLDDASTEGGVVLYSDMAATDRAVCADWSAVSAAMAQRRRWVSQSVWKVAAYVDSSRLGISIDSELFRRCDVFSGPVRWPKCIGALQQHSLANPGVVWFETNGPTSTTGHMDLTGGISHLWN
jgi:hypothetical protein